MKCMSSIALLPLFALIGCGGSTPSPPPSVTTRSQMLGNVPFFLVRVNRDVAEPKKPPTFEELFKQASDDAECQALARRLFWSLPVDFAPAANNAELTTESMPDKIRDQAFPAEWNRKAKEESGLVYFRARAEPNASQSTPNVIVGALSVRRISRRPIDKASPLNASSLERAFDDADDFEAILLLCNDFLLRHDADWIMLNRDGRTKEALEKTKLDLKEVKADHEHRIEAYIKKYVDSGKPSLKTP